MRVFESNGEEAFQQAGVSQLQIKMVCERPPRSLRSRLPPHEGQISFILPLRARGRAAEGGRGSLTHHLEFELGNTPEGNT
jgi:hypothetical protein